MFPLQFLKLNGGNSTLKTSLAGQVILLMQPSLAAAGRAFSLLTNSFSDEQRRSLEDYIGLSINTLLHVDVVDFIFENYVRIIGNYFRIIGRI